MRKVKIACLSFVMPAFIFCFSSCFSSGAETFERKQQEYPEPTQACSIDYENKKELGEDALFLADLGIIREEDYPALNVLSRGLAAHMAADISGLSGKAAASSYTHPFIDLSKENEKEISFLYYNSIVDGITNNSFMEDELCGLDVFLTYLIRALDFAGGTQSTVDENTAIAEATHRGIISEEYTGAGDGLLSVDEALTICRNALYTYINPEQTLLTYLSYEGVVTTYDVDYDSAYEIEGPQAEPFFQETFNNKIMDGDNVKSSDGNIVWKGSGVKGTNNAITTDGYMQIAGDGQYLKDNQQIALNKSLMQKNESFAMTFTVNVQCLGNEGDEGRAVFRVIPRTADSDFTKYYSINYFMVIPLGSYESNLGRCKWSITNTNAPTGSEPLAEAYFLLKENVDYTARVLIENTDDGNVHIEFYIEGADHLTENTKPLLEYTDTSEYKIMESAQGPAFGNSGYLDFGWGMASCVLFDDVKIYDTDSFRLKMKMLEEYGQTEVNMSEDSEIYCQLTHLINNGIIKPYQRHIDFAGNVSVEQFLATAMYLNEKHMAQGQSLSDFVMPEYKKLFAKTASAGNTDLSRDITRYEAAVIIKGMMKGQPETYRYQYFFADKLETDYAQPVYYAVQNSYLLLDGENKFGGNGNITRKELLEIMAKAVDSALRDTNYILRIPAIFSDNAILQRNKPIPISGMGMSGDTVTVEFAGQKKTAKVTDGKWLIELDSMPAGGPYDLKISDSGYSYTYKSLYVGEVFVVAGQSNAEWNLYESADNADTLKKFNDQTKVRLFCPASVRSTTPRFDSETIWQMAKDEWSEHIFGGASAIGVFSVQKLMELNNDLEGVKIGIIQMTYGGTSIELFMPTCVCDKYDFEQADDEFIYSGFWNGYMAGITPYAARALMYYQGENSTQLEYMYELFLRDYIWGVRKEFYDENLPVMLVQIAGYGDSYGQESDAWPKIREVQQRVVNTTENTGIVTAIDLSDPDRFNIHPTQKKPIGDRLAWLMMDLVYGNNTGKTSRQMTEYSLNDGVYGIKFGAEKLTFAVNPIGDVDFEIRTVEGKWILAQSEIKDDTLYIWAEGIENPTGARYAWANYPRVVLYDEKGLPVLPFNTTKDFYAMVSAQEYTTDETHLKKPYHLMETNDIVINMTRNSELRTVRVLDAYRVEYMDGKIEGQQPGDQIILLKKGENLICESGTNSTEIKKTAHGLKKGDWVYNTKYGQLRQVLEVIDENTFKVDNVYSQAPGNIFEVFILTAQVTAQK